MSYAKLRDNIVEYLVLPYIAKPYRADFLPSEDTHYFKEYYPLRENDNNHFEPSSITCLKRFLNILTRLDKRKKLGLAGDLIYAEKIYEDVKILLNQDISPLQNFFGVFFKSFPIRSLLLALYQGKQIDATYFFSALSEFRRINRIVNPQQLGNLQNKSSSQDPQQANTDSGNDSNSLQKFCIYTQSWVTDSYASRVKKPSSALKNIECILQIMQQLQETESHGTKKATFEKIQIFWKKYKKLHRSLATQNKKHAVETILFVDNNLSELIVDLNNSLMEVSAESVKMAVTMGLEPKFFLKFLKAAAEQINAMASVMDVTFSRDKTFPYRAYTFEKLKKTWRHHYNQTLRARKVIHHAEIDLEHIKSLKLKSTHLIQVADIEKLLHVAQTLSHQNEIDSDFLNLIQNQLRKQKSKSFNPESLQKIDSTFALLAGFCLSLLPFDIHQSLLNSVDTVLTSSYLPSFLRSTPGNAPGEIMLLPYTIYGLITTVEKALENNIKTTKNDFHNALTSFKSIDLALAKHFSEFTDLLVPSETGQESLAPPVQTMQTLALDAKKILRKKRCQLSDYLYQHALPSKKKTIPRGVDIHKHTPIREEDPLLERVTKLYFEFLLTAEELLDECIFEDNLSYESGLLPGVQTALTLANIKKHTGRVKAKIKTLKKLRAELNKPEIVSLVMQTFHGIELPFINRNAILDSVSLIFGFQKINDAVISRIENDQSKASPKEGQVSTQKIILRGLEELHQLASCIDEQEEAVMEPMLGVARRLLVSYKRQYPSSTPRMDELLKFVKFIDTFEQYGDSKNPIDNYMIYRRFKALFHDAKSKTSNTLQPRPIPITSVSPTKGDDTSTPIENPITKDIHFVRLIKLLKYKITDGAIWLKDYTINLFNLENLKQFSQNIDTALVDETRLLNFLVCVSHIFCDRLEALNGLRAGTLSSKFQYLTDTLEEHAAQSEISLRGYKYPYLELRKRLFDDYIADHQRQKAEWESWYNYLTNHFDYHTKLKDFEHRLAQLQEYRRGLRADLFEKSLTRKKHNMRLKAKFVLKKEIHHCNQITSVANAAYQRSRISGFWDATMNPRQKVIMEIISRSTKLRCKLDKQLQLLLRGELDDNTIERLAHQKNLLSKQMYTNWMQEKYCEGKTPLITDVATTSPERSPRHISRALQTPSSQKSVVTGNRHNPAKRYAAMTAVLHPKLFGLVQTMSKLQTKASKITKIIFHLFINSLSTSKSKKNAITIAEFLGQNGQHFDLPFSDTQAGDPAISQFKLLEKNPQVIWHSPVAPKPLSNHPTRCA